MKNKNGVGTQNRLFWILMLVFFLMGLLILRLVHIQFIDGKKYSQWAVDQQTRNSPISSKRGTIYDRNYNVLAQTASTDTVTASPESLNNYSDKQVREIANGLGEILDMDKEKLYKELKSGKKNIDIKKKIDKKQADAIKDKGYAGVTLIEDFKRYYPGGSLAAHIVGFVGSDNQGLEGIEKIYENYLKGLPGKIIAAKNAAGYDMPYKYEKYIDPKNGVNVVLTIDEVIQRKVEDCLKKTVENYNVQNGAACIIMGAKTGEVLAMATHPTFDLNDAFTIVDEETKEEIDQIEDTAEKDKAYSDALHKQWRNKAVVDSYEPGSTFKSMVAAMALEEDIVSLNEQFVCNGSVHVGDHDIHCWNRNGHGTESFTQGVYNSCNPVFMSIGARLGNARFYKYYRAFGFDSTTGFDLPGEAAGAFYSMDRFNETELATSSFGQGFIVTPLQLITAYSAITNDGIMVKPRLVKALVDNDRKVIQNFETETIRQVVSKETADTVCEILEGVAAEGTSKNAYIEGFRIAGKTGTSEKVPRGNGKYIASFVGFAPADDPEVICLLMFDEPMGASYMGGQIAAPAFKEIMSDVLVHLQIESSSKVHYNFVPDVKGKNNDEAIALIKENGLKYYKYGEGETIVTQNPMPGTALGDGGVVILYTEEKETDNVVVPDLNGYFASDANIILTNAGLNMKVKGGTAADRSALVGTQSPEAGTEVPRGSIVTVEFNYTTNVH